MDEVGEKWGANCRTDQVYVGYLVIHQVHSHMEDYPDDDGNDSCLLKGALIEWKLA